MFSETDAYTWFMGRWSRQLAPMMLKFVRLAEPEAVLDVGTGTGVLASAVADAHPGASVTGIDPSAMFVETASHRNSSLRLRFQVGDAQVLEFPDAAFDAALSLLALNFMPDPPKALGEMIRVTRAGGVVAAAVWDYADGMEMLRVFWDEAVALDPAMASRDERHMALCRRGELAALWREAGLGEVDEQPLTIDLVFESFDDYWLPFLGGVGPAGAYAASLAAPARDALRAHLAARLSKGREDQVISLKARAWAVRGIAGSKPAGSKDPALQRSGSPGGRDSGSPWSEQP
jgi:SAM-dependent methyltransferase